MDPSEVVARYYQLANAAVTARGASFEADVCNYFQMRDGQIAYMKNFHDTKPFAPLFTDEG